MFRPDTYWHSTGSTMFLWNSKLRQGWCPSISWIVEQNPEMADATTLYAALNAHQDKEQVWEQIRSAEFSHLPSRNKALFVFPTLGELEMAENTWWQVTQRRRVQILVAADANIHAADSRWLDGEPSNWEENSRRYWSGELSSVPLREVIVHGMAWIPNIGDYEPITLTSFSPF